MGLAGKGENASGSPSPALEADCTTHSCLTELSDETAPVEGPLAFCYVQVASASAGVGVLELLGVRIGSGSGSGSGNTRSAASSCRFQKRSKKRSFECALVNASALQMCSWCLRRSNGIGPCVELSSKYSVREFRGLESNKTYTCG